MVKVIVLLTNGDHTENTILIRNSIYQKYNKDNISTEIIVQERIKRGLKYISKTLFQIVGILRSLQDNTYLVFFGRKDGDHSNENFNEMLSIIKNKDTKQFFGDILICKIDNSKLVNLTYEKYIQICQEHLKISENNSDNEENSSNIYNSESEYESQDEYDSNNLNVSDVDLSESGLSENSLSECDLSENSLSDDDLYEDDLSDLNNNSDMDLIDDIGGDIGDDGDIDSDIDDIDNLDLENIKKTDDPKINYLGENIVKKNKNNNIRKKILNKKIKMVKKKKSKQVISKSVVGKKHVEKLKKKKGVKKNKNTKSK